MTAPTTSDPERIDDRDVRDSRYSDRRSPTERSRHSVPSKRRPLNPSIDPKKLPSEISVLEIRVGMVQKVCVLGRVGVYCSFTFLYMIPHVVDSHVGSLPKSSRWSQTSFCTRMQFMSVLAEGVLPLLNEIAVRAFDKGSRAAARNFHVRTHTHMWSVVVVPYHQL